MGNLFTKNCTLSLFFIFISFILFILKNEGWIFTPLRVFKGLHQSYTLHLLSIVSGIIIDAPLIQKVSDLPIPIPILFIFLNFFPFNSIFPFQLNTNSQNHLKFLFWFFLILMDFEGIETTKLFYSPGTCSTLSFHS